MMAYLLIMLSAAPATSAQFDFCVHGANVEFSQTVSIRLEAEGIDSQEDASQLVGELVNRRLWERRAKHIEVQPDQGAICRAAAGDRVTLRLHLERAELSKLLEELNAIPPIPTPSLDALQITVSHLMSASDDNSVQELEIFYATNRHDKGPQQKNTRYTGERSKALSYGKISATVRTDTRMKWLRSLAVFRILPALRPDREVRIRQLTSLKLQNWKQELAQKLSIARDAGVLLFIHGYNVTFQEAALRTAQLAADLAFEGAPMFFSWPSRGELGIGAYMTDKEAARASASYLRELLRELTELPGSPPIYVIAHSMGNETLVAALESLYRKTNEAPLSLKEIILTAPDVDAERFEGDHAKVIVRSRPRITLYGSATDIPLMISDDFQKSRRLGDTSRGITVIPPMETIDATAVKTDFVGHSYYGDSRTVLSDLFYLIRNGLSANERFGIQRVQSDQGALYWKFK
ncbi:MAG: alpha/beta hydrolase [Nitrospira sp.]